MTDKVRNANLHAIAFKSTRLKIYSKKENKCVKINPRASDKVFK